MWYYINPVMGVDFMHNLCVLFHLKLACDELHFKLKCVQFRILGWFCPKLVIIDFCFTQNDVFQQYDEEMKGQKLLDS